MIASTPDKKNHSDAYSQRYDYTVPPEETMKALHDLVQSGKVRYIGASSMWTCKRDITRYHDSPF